MRMMMHAHIEALKGTEALKSGRFTRALDGFVERFKPEAIYFVPDRGMRSCIFVFEMAGSQQLPEVSEPFFELGYEVTVRPCMTPGDLQVGLSASGF